MIDKNLVYIEHSNPEIKYFDMGGASHPCIPPPQAPELSPLPFTKVLVAP